MVSKHPVSFMQSAEPGRDTVCVLGVQTLFVRFKEWVGAS